MHLRLDRLAELVSDAAGDKALLDACEKANTAAVTAAKAAGDKALLDACEKANTAAIAAAKSALEKRFSSSPFEHRLPSGSDGKLVAHMDPDKLPESFPGDRSRASTIRAGTTFMVLCGMRTRRKFERECTCRECSRQTRIISTRWPSLAHFGSLRERTG